MPRMPMNLLGVLCVFLSFEMCLTARLPDAEFTQIDDAMGPSKAEDTASKTSLVCKYVEDKDYLEQRESGDYVYQVTLSFPVSTCSKCSRYPELTFGRTLIKEVVNATLGRFNGNAKEQCRCSYLPDGEAEFVELFYLQKLAKACTPVRCWDMYTRLQSKAIANKLQEDVNTLQGWKLLNNQNHWKKDDCVEGEPGLSLAPLSDEMIQSEGVEVTEESRLAVVKVTPIRNEVNDDDEVDEEEKEDEGPASSPTSTTTSSELITTTSTTTVTTTSTTTITTTSTTTITTTSTTTVTTTSTTTVTTTSTTTVTTTSKPAALLPHFGCSTLFTNKFKSITADIFKRNSGTASEDQRHKCLKYCLDHADSNDYCCQFTAFSEGGWLYEDKDNMCTLVGAPGGEDPPLVVPQHEKFMYGFSATGSFEDMKAGQIGQHTISNRVPNLRDYCAWLQNSDSCDVSRIA